MANEMISAHIAERKISLKLRAAWYCGYELEDFSKSRGLKTFHLFQAVKKNCPRFCAI